MGITSVVGPVSHGEHGGWARRPGLRRRGKGRAANTPVPQFAEPVQHGCSRLAAVSRPTAAAIAAELRESIRTGRYGPGVQLPSASVLQARHGVARGTVTTAIGMLKCEGLVTSRPGAGWFVTEPTEPQDVHRVRLPVSGRQRPHIIERVTTRPASLADAERLHITLGSPVLEIHRTVVYPDGATSPQGSAVLTADHALVYELPAEQG